MNIFSYLFEKFFSLEKWSMGILVTLSLILSFFYANISSRISAGMIESAQKNEQDNIYKNFYYFIAASAIFLGTYYIYKITQNKLLMKLHHWIKEELFGFILKFNNDNMSNKNFANFIVPITRVSTTSMNLMNDILTNLIPTVGFLLVIFGYFYWKNWKLGLGFLLANVLIFAYLGLYWKDMFDYKKKQEEMVVQNEEYILDNLNNIEKVIYRGEMKNEMNLFQKKTDECMVYTLKMMNYMTNHTFIMNSFVYVTIFGCLYYTIDLHKTKQMDTITFITLLTMLIMYRDNISDTIQSVPYNMESLGRIDLITRDFNEMVGDVNIADILKKGSIYKSVDLPFDRIEFRGVSFKYPAGDHTVFANYNQDLDLQNKIIGIIGLSGNGKSSFAKLILRLHECTGGKIYIDGVDIQTIDPFYIRENITYVTQSSKLFDRKVLDNIYYGCKDTTQCEKYLSEILEYPKIKELYRNVDLNDPSGPLGENLSGGQRQVANLISGLINPTKILILDEPTNALDPELKREILLVIQRFRKYKKCIMIITHDKDVYSLFDETVEI
jgi:ABC-type multidrug transport system fused ATPase/permease subunit